MGLQVSEQTLQGGALWGFCRSRFQIGCEGSGDERAYFGKRQWRELNPRECQGVAGDSSLQAQFVDEIDGEWRAGKYIHGKRREAATTKAERDATPVHEQKRDDDEQVVRGEYCEQCHTGAKAD